MGAIARAVGSIFGGSAPKANVSAAYSKVDDEEMRNKRARSALLESAASTYGAQLQPGQVQGGGNVFGN